MNIKPTISTYFCSNDQQPKAGNQPHKYAKRSLSLSDLDCCTKIPQNKISNNDRKNTKVELVPEQKFRMHFNSKNNRLHSGQPEASALVATHLPESSENNHDKKLDNLLSDNGDHWRGLSNHDMKKAQANRVNLIESCQKIIDDSSCHNEALKKHNEIKLKILNMLTEAEYIAIYAYTLDYYSHMIQCARGEKSDAHWGNMINLVTEANQALTKLSNLKELKSDPEKMLFKGKKRFDVNLREEHFKENSHFIENGFMSTTTSKEIAHNFMSNRCYDVVDYYDYVDNSLLIHIKGESGVDISSISGITGTNEKEYLFKPGAIFKVLFKGFDPNFYCGRGAYKVFIEESSLSSEKGLSARLVEALTLAK